MTKQKYMMAGVGVLGIGLVGGLVWSQTHKPHHPARYVYSSVGYGGVVAVSPPPKVASPTAWAAQAHPHTSTEQLRPAITAYNAGDYRTAETAALTVVAQGHSETKKPVVRQVVMAQQILAYSAARRKDLTLARTRFAAMQHEAAKLPDKGAQVAPSGQPTANLEEEAAFQHAVCTGALGDHAGAEAEYRNFMRSYPESPLIQAAITRIGRFHNGNVPPDALAIWQEAQKTAKEREKARAVEASLCGPECLAELLHRRGESLDVHRLASEMKTGDQGTALGDLADAVTSHGFEGKGLALTMRGLQQQTLPVIALIRPGHYVIVDRLSATEITAWDPDLHGVGKGGPRRYAVSEWTNLWHGVTLTLQSSDHTVKTAKN